MSLPGISTTKSITADVANQQETNSHISYCVTAKCHIIHTGTHAYHTICFSNTCHCSGTFIVNITHQHDYDRTHQAICCFACYFVGLVVELRKSRMRLANRELATHGLGVCVVDLEVVAAQKLHR